MMDNVMNWIAYGACWSASLGLLFNYVLYPLAIIAIANLQRRSSTGEDPCHEAASLERPHVTVLVAVYNAEESIRSRIENILCADYPPERLRVLVASDGSNDKTVEVVCSIKDPRVRCVAYAQRRGKAATLVEAIQQIDSGIVLFTDATTRFEVSSIGALIRHFDDSAVGIVSGRVVILDSQGKRSESIYWRSELAVRKAHAALGITLGASGAIYAMRRELFVASNCPVINDDLVFPALAALHHPLHARFEDAAIALVVGGTGWTAEFRRRIRIGSGAMQCVIALREIFSIRHLKQASAFVSHKVLRWMGPILLLAIAVSTWWLSDQRFYQVAMWAQLTAVVISLVGLLPLPEKLAKAIRPGTSFLLMNFALLVGGLKWMMDPNQVTWQPTRRSPEQPSDSRDNARDRVA